MVADFFYSSRIGKTATRHSYMLRSLLYQMLVQDGTLYSHFRATSVAVFFSEYGCNEPSGAEARIFQETGALYSEKMSSVFSGGIVYMYFQEANDYGKLCNFSLHLPGFLSN